MTVLENAWVIPALPLASWVVITLFNRRLGPRTAYLGTASVSASLLLSAAAFAALLAAGHPVTGGWRWLTVGRVTLHMGYVVDNLASVMLVMVSLVSTCVHFYSIGYMHGDRRYGRFFGTLSLFTSAMLCLVLADNFLLLLISWEVMGLCSYLLIGHWFEQAWPKMASMKAFMTTRVGDVGMMVGIWLLFTHTGTFNIAEISASAADGRLAPLVVTVAAVLLFAGAVGKSAQFPLHVWLPDAMAGPTPVSALIHAATMVAAGVYLVARSYGIFVHSPEAMLTVAVIGGLTALFAATVATVMTDFKAVLAYSTISQLGYMMLGLGVGGFVAGVFHLLTHAFFKALLFLTAGSVSHATGTLEIHEMGGLRRKMRLTFWTFLIGALALAGIPPLAGFWSKDEILVAAYGSGHPVLFWMAVGAAFLTAYYMTRLTCLVFLGRPRDVHRFEHAHEAPRVMAGPLVVLASLAALAGLPGSPVAGCWLGRFLDFSRSVPGLAAAGHAAAHAAGHTAGAAQAAAHAAHTAHAAGPVLPVALGAALLGIAAGYVLYGTRLIDRAVLIRAFRPVYTLLKSRYYLDEVYGSLLVRPAVRLAELCGVFDLRVIDGAVNGVAAAAVEASRAARRFDDVVIDGAVEGVAAAAVEASRAAGQFDDVVIDGAVNGVAAGAVAGGRTLRRVHTGQVQGYMAAIYAGAALALAALVWMLL